MSKTREELIQECQVEISRKERPEFYNTLAEEAKTNGFEDLYFTFLGYLKYYQDKYEEAETGFKKAIDLNDSLGYPWIGLGIIYTKLTDFNGAIDAYKKAIELDDMNSVPWNNLGNVYKKMKVYDKAIDAYNKAIELDETDDDPWNGLGNVYAELKDYNKAIELFNKAIEFNDTNCHPWNGLGNAYKNLQVYDKAIIAYNKAIELDETYAYPWNGLGNLYKNLNKYDIAIKAYKRAIELDDTYATPRYGLGNVYKELNDYDNALKAYKEGLSLIDEDKDFALKHYLKKRITELSEYINAESLNKENGALYDPLRIILEKTKTMQQEVFENQRLFTEFISEKPDKDGNDEENDNEADGNFYLEVLRRWNSYTPIVADNFSNSKGGGYFINVFGLGIVIDPGFNFIENFKVVGHKFYEIDTVVVSHAHNDHTSDIESILTLLYKYNELIKGSAENPELGTIWSELSGNNKYLTDDEEIVIPQDDIEKAFNETGRRKIINYYISQSVFKKFSGLFDLCKSSDYILHVFEDNNSFYLDDDATIKMETLPAKHFDIISDRHTCGFMFTFEMTNSPTIIYSSDTGWNDEIEKAYSEVSERLNRDDPVCLIAHLGGFKDYENKYPANLEQAYYKNHLGRLGLAKLNDIIKPDICIISEFGEELKGYRIRIAEIYNEAFNNEIVFLPSDIGLIYNLSSGCIKAIKDIKTENQITKLSTGQEIKTYTSSLEFAFIEPEFVEVFELGKAFSLHYYDNRTKINCVKLNDVLRDDYELMNK